MQKGADIPPLSFAQSVTLSGNLPTAMSLLQLVRRYRTENFHDLRIKMTAGGPL